MLLNISQTLKTIDASPEAASVDVLIVSSIVRI
jgi:hypothetical protein